MAKSKRKKRQRKPSTKEKEKKVAVASSGGGGLMQSMRSGFKRAVTGDNSEESNKPSTVSNVIWTLLFLAALGLLAYRLFG